MSKQSFTTGQVLTAAQVNSLQANDYNQTVSVKTANYTLAAADKGTRIEFNTSGSVTCTVNNGLFDAGDTLVIQNRGAGTATVTAGTATVNTSATLVLDQYDSGTLYFISDSAAIFFNTDAGGGGGSMTEIASGSAPTGANNFTISAIPSGYRDLRVEFYDVRPGNDDNIHCRINGASGSVYFDSAGPMGNNMTVGTLLRFQGFSDNTATGGFTVGVFFDYLGNHWKMLQTIGIFPNASTPTNANGNFYCGGSNQTAAITSLNFYTEGGSNFTGGTYKLYGVN